MSRLSARLRVLVACALLAVTACGGVPASAVLPPNPLAAASAPALHVAGNQLVDNSNRPVVLHGVNRSGPEFWCHGKGVNGRVFDGPSDDASVAAIAAWTGVNTVRVPLNEDCWLGLQGADPSASGAVYQLQIQDYVRKLHEHGLNAILDLHWTDGVDRGTGVQCADATAACQKPMPDAGHAPEFWASVAKTFADDPATVFDLFNEPFQDVAHEMPAAQAWRCWRDGGSACPGFAYTVAGMQSLVDAVRGAGARNVVMLGGLSWSHDLTGWLAHKPRDATGNTVASWHSYNFNACTYKACWDREIAPVAKAAPVIVGEIGQDDCGHDFVGRVMPWLDGHRISYLAWTWNTYSQCKKSPILITDYNGTPTAYGKAIKDHLASLSAHH